jgi:hypothetical protein
MDRLINRSDWYIMIRLKSKPAFVRNMSGYCQGGVKQAKGPYKVPIFSL